MEPKTERMCLPQWDGDPSGWRDYQQEVRLHKTGENLEVNWSVAARLEDSEEQQRRVGLAMTDQELLPTARNITDNWERLADRNRRGIEALMAGLKQSLDSNDHRRRVKALRCSLLEQAPEETWRAHHGLYHQVRGGYQDSSGQ